MEITCKLVMMCPESSQTNPEPDPLGMLMGSIENGTISDAYEVTCTTLCLQFYAILIITKSFIS